MTMLLESTYFALTNSFRAILNVAESIGKLRSILNQLFSTFALIRFLKWLYRKIVRTTGKIQYYFLNLILLLVKCYTNFIFSF